ncbi:hypothetical protein [Scytonema sp. PCC 10023]
MLFVNGAKEMVEGKNQNTLSEANPVASALMAKMQIAREDHPKEM